MKLDKYKIWDRFLIKEKWTKIEKIVALKNWKRVLIDNPKQIF